MFLKNLMNKNALSIVFGLCSIFTLAQTAVSGGIYQNTTWTLAGSPYIVNSSIVVFPGNTLTIQPGVEIQINNQTSSTIYIEARGTINCIGTTNLPIKIYPLYDTLNPVAWQGFVCTSSQGGVLNANRVQISNAHFPFSYETPLASQQYTNCVFKRCFQAVTVNNSVELSNCQFIDNEVGVYGWSNFSIDNCLFKDNNTSIFAYASALTMTNTVFIDNQIGLSFAANIFDSMYVSDCQFLNNSLALNYPNNGIVKNCQFSDNDTAINYAYKCEIENNEFTYNELALDASVNADIHNNQINNNWGGLVISAVTNAQDSPLIYDNQICGNINFNVSNNTNMNYSLLSNCFCDLDSAQIEALLIDGYDDITKGLINFQVYDSSCTVLVRSVFKYGLGADSEEARMELRFENPVNRDLVLLGDVACSTITVSDLRGASFVFRTSGSNKFDVSSLPAGLYILTSVNDQNVKKRFVKL
jgi:hypothetical protein